MQLPVEQSRRAAWEWDMGELEARGLNSLSEQIIGRGQGGCQDHRHLPFLDREISGSPAAGFSSSPLPPLPHLQSAEVLPRSNAPEA